MCERKIWKVEEDQILKELYELRNIKKWSQISKLMQVSYGIQGRNGKQCRQRYHNHLKSGINKEKWSKTEQIQLIALHAQHGNRWALISKLIVGRTENCVKNMLYSKLRKSIRRLNRFGYQHYRKELKEIKINFIYRLVQFTQQSYQKQSHQRNQQEKTAIRLKNDLLNLQNMEEQNQKQSQQFRMKQLIQDIHLFKKANQRYRGHLHKNNKIKNNVRKGKDLQSNGNLDHDVCSIELVGKNKGDYTIKTKESGLQSVEQNLIIETKQKQQNHTKQKIQAMLVNSSQIILPTNTNDFGLQQPLLNEAQLLNYMTTPIQSQNNIEDWPNTSQNWHSFITFLD